ALQAEGTSYTYSGGESVAVDRWHNCFITGYFGGPTAFGGFKLTETGENPGFLDAFVAKLGTNVVPPSVMVQPLSHVVIEGNDLELRAAASGTTPIAYQWQLNGVAVPAATNAIFKVVESDPGMAGDYRVIA